MDPAPKSLNSHNATRQHPNLNHPCVTKCLCLSNTKPLVCNAGFLFKICTLAKLPWSHKRHCATVSFHLTGKAKKRKNTRCILVVTFATNRNVVYETDRQQKTGAARQLMTPKHRTGSQYCFLFNEHFNINFSVW